jgi:hypothetical protein
MIRGIEGRKIFLDEKDYEDFIEHLEVLLLQMRRPAVWKSSRGLHPELAKNKEFRQAAANKKRGELNFKEVFDSNPYH